MHDVDCITSHVVWRRMSGIRVYLIRCHNFVIENHIRNLIIMRVRVRVRARDRTRDRARARTRTRIRT